MDLHPQLAGDPRQLVREPCRVDHRGLVGDLAATEEERAVDERADPRGVQPVGPEPVELVLLDRGVDDPGALPLTIQAPGRHVGLEGVEVLAAEPVQDVVLVGPARAPVGLAVRDRGLAEPAVATRRRPADALCLEQHDVPARVAPLGQHRGPEAEVAASDDDQVGPARGGQRRRCGHVAGVLEPEHRLPRGPQRLLDQPRVGGVPLVRGGRGSCGHGLVSGGWGSGCGAPSVAFPRAHAGRQNVGDRAQSATHRRSRSGTLVPCRS